MICTTVSIWALPVWDNMASRCTQYTGHHWTCLRVRTPQTPHHIRHSVLDCVPFLSMLPSINVDHSHNRSCISEEKNCLQTIVYGSITLKNLFRLSKQGVKIRKQISNVGENSDTMSRTNVLIQSICWETMYLCIFRGAMSSVCILGYWDIRGLAEPIRLLLEHVEANYEDRRWNRCLW